MARKQLGDYTELGDLSQVADRSPKTTDRIPITRGGRNLNMCISTLMEYLNAHLSLEGEGVTESIAALNEAVEDLQEQLDTLTQTDLAQLLNDLQSLKDFLDEFGSDEDLSSVLLSLRESIEDAAAETYATKTELSDVVDAVEQNTAAIEQIDNVGSGNVRLTRTAYNALKNAGSVDTNVWYIVTDNIDQTIIREIRLGLVLIAKNEEQGNTGFTYVFPFTFIS